MKTLIKNGFIVDGTNQSGFYGDILINENYIEKIGTDISTNADYIIDAANLVVSPGFIDAHSHSDIEIIKSPFIEYKIRQGITTEIIGQDGISISPLPKHLADEWVKSLSSISGDSDGLDLNVETTKDYFGFLEERGLGINEAYLLPHGNVRMEVMGLENRKPTDFEINKMKDIIRREMESGCIGFSTGLIYVPCIFADIEELIECCKIVKEYNGIFVAHQRSEGDNILESMDELIEIGRRTGINIHISHIKIVGKKRDENIGKMLEKIEQATSEGINITFDQYPYISGNTMIKAIIPSWACAGGNEQLINRLKSLKVRKEISLDIMSKNSKWDNFIDLVGFEQIFISSVKSEKNYNLLGKNLKEVAETLKKDVLEGIYDLIIEENCEIGIIINFGSEEHLEKFMKHPSQCFCTDGLINVKPHPRLYGAFPRVFRKYVKEKNLLTIEEVVHNMTFKPANIFGFYKRGAIKVGWKADIVIFNKNEISDEATFDSPMQFSKGVKYVFINGKMALENCVFKDNISGEIIKGEFL